MPFDKDSFLKGVITGMRLPRTPGGERPFRPIPGRKFILTESGDHVITEKVGSGLATFYSINSYETDFKSLCYKHDYKYPTDPASDVVATNVDCYFLHLDSEFSPSDLVNMQYFFWVRNRYFNPDFPIKDTLCVFLWQDSRYDHDFLMFEAPNISTWGSAISLDANPHQAGSCHYTYTYLSLPYNVSPGTGNTVYFWNNAATMFEGTEAELDAFIAELRGMPMITEGDDENA